MRIYITKSELKNSLSLNGRRVLITLSEICEAMSVSENTVRPLINGLTKFKFTDNGRKLWYKAEMVKSNTSATPTKKRKSHIEEINAAARAAGMTYGKYKEPDIKSEDRNDKRTVKQGFRKA